MNKGVCWFLGMLTGMVVTVGAEAIVVAAVPTKVYTNNIAGTEIVGSNIGDRGLLDVIMNIKTFKIDDIPAIKTLLDELLKSGSFGDFIALDYNKIKDLNLTDPQLAEKIRNAIEIVASLKSLRVDLGSFGNLAMFKSWEPVDPSILTPEEIRKNPKLYYYQTSGGGYARAFGDDGSYQPGVTEETPIFYANLSEIPVTELFVHVSPRVMRMKVGAFAEQFLGKGLSSKVNALIGDYLVSDLDKIDVNSFKLTEFVNNEEVILLMEDMTGKDRADITIGDLDKISTEDVRLISVLPYKGSEKLYDLLCDATGKTKDEITVGQLSKVDFDACHLKHVIDSSDPSNDKLYQLLSDITGKEKDDILVSDLSGVDIGKAKLTSFLAYAGNEQLYQVLLDVTGETDYTKLTVNAMNGADMGLVKLSTFIEPTGNDDLYTVLLDMIHAKGGDYAGRTPETVLLKDLNNLDFGAVRLSSVWGTSSKDTGNAILDVLLKDDTVTVGNLASKINALTINELFGAECFTTDREKAFVHYDTAHPGEDLIDVYNLDAGNYVYNTTIATADPTPDNAYYISATAGVWLLFSYNVADADINTTNGRAEKLTPSTVTFDQLQNDASAFSDTIGKARMYQLISSGVVQDSKADPYKDSVKKLNLKQVLDLIP